MQIDRPKISAPHNHIVELLYAAFTDDSLIAYIKEALLPSMTDLQLSGLVYTALDAHDYGKRTQWEQLLNANLQLDCTGMDDSEVFEKSLPYIIHELTSTLYGDGDTETN